MMIICEFLALHHSSEGRMRSRHKVEADQTVMPFLSSVETDHLETPHPVLLFRAQVSVARSTSPSRNVSGTTTALTVRSAPCPWWGAASSRRETTSSAPTVGRTSEGSAREPQPVTRRFGYFLS